MGEQPANLTPLPPDGQEADAKQEQRKLDELTSRGGLGRPRAVAQRPHKQFTLSFGSKLQLDADQALGRAFYSTGASFNMLDNPEVQCALRKA